MSELVFKNPEELNRKELLKKFSSGDSDEICEALISMAFDEEDWQWAQNQCLYFLESPDSGVRGIAATCLGHVARYHRKLDRELVEEALSKHLDDKEIFGQVDEALDDIKFYLELKDTDP